MSRLTRIIVGVLVLVALVAVLHSLNLPALLGPLNPHALR